MCTSIPFSRPGGVRLSPETCLGQKLQEFELNRKPDILFTQEKETFQ